MRKVIVFTLPEPEIWVEGKNCDQIMDERGEYPIVKVYVKDIIHIYKGVPFMLEVDRHEERRNRRTA